MSFVTYDKRRMHNHNDRKYLLRNARWTIRYRQRKNKGRGHLYVDSNYRCHCKTPLHVLNVKKTWRDEMGDSYVLTHTIKIPRALMNVDLSILADYLDDRGLIDDEHCCHDYDCCGHFYPSGCASVIKRKGREIVIAQNYERNI